jgi:hypothetical protein
VIVSKGVVLDATCIGACSIAVMSSRRSPRLSGSCAAILTWALRNLYLGLQGCAKAASPRRASLGGLVRRNETGGSS